MKHARATLFHSDSGTGHEQGWQTPDCPIHHLQPLQLQISLACGKAEEVQPVPEGPVELERERARRTKIMVKDYNFKVIGGDGVEAYLKEMGKQGWILANIQPASRKIEDKGEGTLETVMAILITMEKEMQQT